MNMPGLTRRMHHEGDLRLRLRLQGIVARFHDLPPDIAETLGVWLDAHTEGRETPLPVGAMLDRVVWCPVCDLQATNLAITAWSVGWGDPLHLLTDAEPLSGERCCTPHPCGAQRLYRLTLDYTPPMPMPEAMSRLATAFGSMFRWLKYARSSWINGFYDLGPSFPVDEYSAAVAAWFTTPIPPEREQKARPMTWLIEDIQASRDKQHPPMQFRDDTVDPNDKA